MATKNNPGAYDCYAKAHPDEPFFTLLGRDPDAPMLVRLWASIRARSGERPEKIAEALQCANAMEAWRDAGPRLAEPQDIQPDVCATCGHGRKLHGGGVGDCAATVADATGICQCAAFVEQEIAS